MSYQQGQPPQLGATFIPGGFDDYYMPAPSPEVISPAPQRIMPEVPENMQENIAHMELEANVPRNSHGPTSPTHSQPSPNFPPRSTSYQHDQVSNGSYGGQAQQWPSRQASISSSFNQPPAVPVQPVLPQVPQSHDYNQFATKTDVPNFSPFPKLQNRPPNVPPSDDEKEAVLDNAREPVLNSNDPEMQLAWAQDALAYVDAAMLHEQRLAELQPARPVTPQVEHQLRMDAMNIVQFLADQHHPKAEFMRGMWLEFGKFGMRVDKKEAFKSYQRAAEKGYARAEYRMGMQFEQSNDPIKALVHYKRGSEAGDSASNYRLGMMTLLGQHGQPQDFSRGIQLIQQAARTADENAPQGAYVLGMLQARELPQINVPEIYLPYDETLARQNIEKAAYLGFAKAQLKMGSAYELCTLGCDFNATMSMHYNALASRQGEPEADMAISKWFLCGQEGEFPKNEELAFQYAQRAAQAGLATAEFAMGYFHEIGMNTRVDLDKAIEWYERAAKQGNKDAASRIEGISNSRTLSKKDHEDVAVAKIKSKHGSMRGQRPARLRAQAPALPVVVDSSPSDYGSDVSSAVSTPVSSRLPNRNESVTPYPLSDKPPAVSSSGPYERASTVAPYPVGDGPPRVGSGSSFGGGFAPEVRAASVAPGRDYRPTSAFNINPNVYSQGPGYPGGGRLPPQGRGDLGPLPLRPHTSMDNMGQGRGRVPSGGRSPSGGLPPGPGAYRGPGGPSVERPESVGTPQPSRPDIGYSAPDGRNRLQKPTKNPNLPDIGFSAPLENKQPPRPSTVRPVQDRPSTVGPGQQRPGTARPYERQGSSPQPSGRPGSRPNSRPGSAGRSSAHDPMPQPPPKNTLPSKPNQQKPVQQKPAEAAKPAAKPSAQSASGKGPKTFDEMGIAQAPKEGDCIVM